MSHTGRLQIIILVLRHKEFNLKSSRGPKSRNYFKFTLVILVLAVNLSFHNSAQASTSVCPDLNTINSISGIRQWLRADCVNGVVEDPADGTSVSTWTDLSGNNNNATTTGTAPTFESDALKLINGNPVINFPNGRPLRGIDIRATAIPNITIFSVYKVNASDNRDGVWGNDDGGWDRFFLATWGGNNGLISAGNNAGVTDSAVLNTPTLITTVLQYGVDGESKVYRNGAIGTTFTDSSNSTGAHNPSYIGSGGNGLDFNGDIAEIIIFNRVLETSELKTVNSYLNTKYSLSIASENLPSVPAAPTSLSATSGNGQATISFTPGSNSGSSITDYEYSINGGTTWTSTGSTTSPITITGLTNGTTYSINLRAVNANGVGTTSSSVSVTPSTTASAPSDLSAAAGNGQVTISFAAGSNGGSSITNYKYSTDSTTYTALSPTDTSSPITIAGLTNGTSYTIYLKAVNANGDSAASSSVTVTPSTTPSAPTSLSANASDGSASISFTTGSDGGSAITNYKYSIDGSTYTALSPSDASSPITISGLTNGTSYTVYLKAVNVNGDSSASSSVSVIPIQPPASSSDSSGPVGFFEPIRKVELRKQKISWEPNNKIVISKYDSGTNKTSIFESVQGEFILQKANPGQTVYYSIMATDGTVLKKVTMKTKPNTPKIAKVASQKSQLLTINNKTAITAQWKKDKSVKKYNIKITLDNGKILAFTTTDPNINLVIDETKSATITITAVGKNNLTSTVTRKI